MANPTYTASVSGPNYAAPSFSAGPGVQYVYQDPNMSAPVYESSAISLVGNDAPGSIYYDSEAASSTYYDSEAAPSTYYDSEAAPSTYYDSEAAPSTYSGPLTVDARGYERPAGDARYAAAAGDADQRGLDHGRGRNALVKNPMYGWSRLERSVARGTVRAVRSVLRRAVDLDRTTKIVCSNTIIKPLQWPGLARTQRRAK